MNVIWCGADVLRLGVGVGGSGGLHGSRAGFSLI